MASTPTLVCTAGTEIVPVTAASPVGAEAGELPAPRSGADTTRAARGATTGAAMGDRNADGAAAGNADVNVAALGGRSATGGAATGDAAAGVVIPGTDTFPTAAENPATDGAVPMPAGAPAALTLPPSGDVDCTPLESELVAPDFEDREFEPCSFEDREWEEGGDSGPAAPPPAP